jgi:hypothetical protein
VDIFEVKRILDRHYRLASLAEDIRKQGQIEFADALLARAVNFLDQIIAEIERDLSERKQQKP